MRRAVSEKMEILRLVEQTDFRYFRIINWGGYYLSTALDDFSRTSIAWKPGRLQVSRPPRSPFRTSQAVGRRRVAAIRIGTR